MFVINKKAIKAYAIH